MPGWDISRTRADDMHCTKLGIALYVIGNTLTFLMNCRAYIRLGPARDHVLSPTASQAEVLDDLTYRFSYWLRIHGLACSIKRFTLKRIHRDTKSDYPAYQCKASEAVPLVAWLADLALQWSECCPHSEREHALIVSRMLWGLSRYFWVCKNAGRFLSVSEREDLYRSGHTFLHMYSELRWRSHEDGSYAFEDGVNPRFFHCFGDEDQ
eukprot:911584-Pyramimonas_sp.AAC.1